MSYKSIRINKNFTKKKSENNDTNSQKENNEEKKHNLKSIKGNTNYQNLQQQIIIIFN